MTLRLNNNELNYNCRINYNFTLEIPFYVLFLPFFEMVCILFRNAIDM